MTDKGVWAFDLGEKCGYAKLARGNRIPSSGTEILSDSFYSGGGYRLFKFRKFLEKDCFGSLRPGLIVYEEVNSNAHSTGHAGHVWGAFYGILAAFCEEYGIPYTGVPQATLKKHATDYCNSALIDVAGLITLSKPSNKSKVIPIAAAERMFGGLQIQDDNHADAVCLLDYALKNLV